MAEILNINSNENLSGFFFTIERTDNVDEVERLNPCNTTYDIDLPVTVLKENVDGF